MGDFFCKTFVLCPNEPPPQTVEQGLAYVRRQRIEYMNLQNTFKRFLSDLRSLTGDIAASKAELEVIEEDIAEIQETLDQLEIYEARYLEIIADEILADAE
jgi:septal ring factor EnvC (AmiA/AmiB activator)